MQDSTHMDPPAPGLHRLRTWLRVLRPRFMVVTLIPVGAGLLISGMFASVDLWTAFLTLFGSTLFLLATNLVDEAWDFLQHQGDTPFVGGSGVIQEGLLSPHEVLRAGQFVFAVCLAGGLYVATLTSWLMGAFTIMGLVTGYYYAAPPIRFGYRGLGEIFCATALGPVLVLGTVYIQLGSVPLLAWAASVPLASTVAFILFAKSIPDIEQDEVNHKWTVAWRLGHTGSLRLYVVWMLATLVLNASLAGVGLLPVSMGLSLVFLLPWASLASRAWQGERDPLFLHYLGRLSLIFYAVNGLLLLAGLYLWWLAA